MNEGKEMFYYFAYGSNMNFKQMKKRCKNAQFLCRAYLEGYKFVYDGYSSKREGAVANIIPTNNKNNIVWGGLWLITKEDLEELDKYEGYPYSYDRQRVRVKNEKGEEFEAWVYLRSPKEPGKPSESYLKIILEGARDCNLPEDYILASLLREV